ncbi:hypothetical protein QYF36_016326 [Acer negundo]|nr:hypothetical protein QYF36_016326 [Acer negundo]
MAPALVLHPPPPPPPPPEFKQFRIVNENGTMSDEFEIGEYDPDLVEMNWGNENGRVAPEVGGLARRAIHYPPMAVADYREVLIKEALEQGEKKSSAIY